MELEEMDFTYEMLHERQASKEIINFILRMQDIYKSRPLKAKEQYIKTAELLFDINKYGIDRGIVGINEMDRTGYNIFNDVINQFDNSEREFLERIIKTFYGIIDDRTDEVFNTMVEDKEQDGVLLIRLVEIISRDRLNSSKSFNEVFNFANILLNKSRSKAFDAIEENLFDIQNNSVLLNYLAKIAIGKVKKYGDPDKTSELLLRISYCPGCEEGGSTSMGITHFLRSYKKGIEYYSLFESYRKSGFSYDDLRKVRYAVDTKREKIIDLIKNGDKRIYRDLNSLVHFMNKAINRYEEDKNKCFVAKQSKTKSLKLLATIYEYVPDFDESYIGEVQFINKYIVLNAARMIEKNDLAPEFNRILNKRGVNIDIP